MELWLIPKKFFISYISKKQKINDLENIPTHTHTQKKEHNNVCVVEILCSICLLIHSFIFNKLIKIYNNCVQ